MSMYIWQLCQETFKQGTSFKGQLSWDWLMIWVARKKNNSVFGCLQDRRYCFLAHKESIIFRDIHHIVGSSIFLDEPRLLFNFFSKAARYDFDPWLLLLISTGNELITWYEWVIEHNLTRGTQKHTFPPKFFWLQHICPIQNDNNWHLIVCMCMHVAVSRGT